MPEKTIIEKKFHYFYKTINQINDNFYYGIHSTNKLEDSYLGSGKILKQAIKKYGRENFKKEIIANFSTRCEVVDYERSFITQELIENNDCYNLQVGGSMVEIKTVTEETRRKQSIAKKENPPMLGKFGELHPFFGKHHTEESLALIREASTGSNNPMFGRTQSDHAKELIGASKRGKPGPKHSIETKQKMSEFNAENKKCIIDGIIFKSIADSIRYFGIPRHIVSYRIKSHTFPTWQLYSEDSAI